MAAVFASLFGGGGGGILAGTFAGSLLGSATASASNPLFEMLNYRMNAHFQQRIFTLNELALMLIRGVINENEYFARAAENGFNKVRAGDFLQASKQFVGIGEIIIMLRKGAMKKEDALKDAIKLGYNAISFEKMLDATEVLPTPNDLTRFLVREVFSDETVKKFGQGAELPTNAYAEFARIGIPAKLADQTSCMSGENL